MARVSLKNSIIRFIDGLRGTAAVNDTPANLDTTVDFDTAAGNTPVAGVMMTVVGSDVRHFITDVSGSTLTFTPAFKSATGIPSDGAVIAFLGRVLEIKVGDGNLTYEEKREIEYVRDRGALDDVQEGDEQPVEVSLSMVWEELRALDPTGTPTPEEVLKQTGAAAAWQSSDSDTCKMYAIDIELEALKAGCPAGFVERVTLPDYRWESLPHNLSDATVETTGKCNATQAIVARIL